MKNWATTTVAGTASILLAGVLVSPAAGVVTQCRHAYDSDDYIVWGSGCVVAMSPGRAGPLRMGRTTVAAAKKMGFVAYNRACNSWEGAYAGIGWKSKGGRVVAWSTRMDTARGLTGQDTLARALILYPSARRTGFMPNAYIDGEGWDIYSVGNAAGWLDIYSYNTSDSHVAGLFFAVRAASVKRPLTGWSQDGC